MNPERAEQVLRLLSAAWPREPLGDESVRLWRAALGGIEHDDATTAAGQLIAESE